MGADIAALQRVRAELPQAATAKLLGGIAGFFRARGQGGMAAADLLPQIDAALAAALQPRDLSAAARSAITALVGLRRNLFPDAPAALSSAHGGATA
jgi:uncharacterized protein YqgC (DUF456 family)